MDDARASLRPGGGYAPAPAATHRTLTAAIEAAAVRHPDRPAVRAGELTLTYAALDAAANRVAHDLLDREPAPGRPVGVVAGQSLELPIAILGVLKAGRPYVPIDPGDAVDRSRATMAEIGIQFLVADPGAAGVAGAIVDPRSVVVANADADAGRAAAPPCDDDGDALAYLYRTSGSTGRPKTVMDSHRNVLDNIHRYTETLAIGPEDRLSLLQTITFSGVVSSLFAALVTGACVCPLDLRRDRVAAVRASIRDERLTMLHVVPALFRLLADGDARFDDLRVVRLEGDAAAWVDVERFRRHVGRDAVLVNGLGATETGLVRQFFVDHRTPPGTGGLPLGYAVPGVEVEIRDDEIVVVGRHLALGYWGDPDRTAVAFEDRTDGRRAYRTGDLGRLAPDGRLYGLGRRDLAAKVRGQTVDLPEIERRLRAEPEVRDAVAVTLRVGDGETRLIAYVVGRDGRAVDVHVLRRRLAAALAREDVPHAVVLLPALPLDANGKVDRARLPAPTAARPDLANPYVAPRTGLETEIVSAWEDVLGIAPVGVLDEFFDLGGDSLDAARLSVALESVADRAVAHDAVLAASTVADLAACLTSADRRGRDGDAAERPSATTWFGFHDAPGHPGFFAHLERAGRGAIVVRAIDPEVRDHTAGSIDRVAAACVDRIGASGEPGPYHLLGYCYAAVVALDVANRLQRAGSAVASVALLGISPLEFPDLVDAAALRRPDRHRALRQRLRAHAAEIGRRPVRDAAGYVAERTRYRLVGSARRLVRDRDDVDPDRSAIATHRSIPFDGRVVVVLGRTAAALYTQTPERAWRRLGRDVDVVILPGHDHAMLTASGAPALVAALEAHAAP